MKSLNNMHVQYLKGVGPKAYEKLAELNIHTVQDLLLFLPSRYESAEIDDLSEVQHEAKVKVIATVSTIPQVTFYGHKKSRLIFTALVNDIAVKIVFFNQPFLKNQLTINQELIITGKWDQRKQQISAIKYQFYKPESLTLHQGAMEAIYPLKQLIHQKTFYKYLEQALPYIQQLTDDLPSYLLKKYQLLPLSETILNLHHPKDITTFNLAKKSYIFRELFEFQLKLQVKMAKFKKAQRDGIAIKYQLDKIKNFIHHLPFELTDAQKKTVNEIFYDLKSDYRMNRLLQGDVGSGKTIVAALAMYAAATANYQSALMVPTEVLAEQHANSLSELFAPYNINIALLTSSVKGKARQLILDNLVDGTIDILIGTHALIQDEVIFKSVGVVITDEQHRFGVKQRQRLKDKGLDTNVLMMTATPIPRTLAISTFGDMDVSIIKELPKGRKKIDTRWAKTQQLPSVLQLMTRELNKGFQAYVICPLIEESEHLELQDALDMYQKLTHYYQDSPYKVGLLHGRMSSHDKDAIMQQFANNDIQILVSTTVIEVGVNVANATFMLISDASRFGLSTLHQLRGRVGRNSYQSYCILVADPKNEAGKERMKILSEVADGFELSERDLKMRGPGDYFGYRQSGLPEFRYANIVEDYQIMAQAREEAASLVKNIEFYKTALYTKINKNLEVME